MAPAAQWRTSWLSREVIVLPAFMGVVFLYGAAHLAGLEPALATLPSGIAIDATVALGVAGTLLAFALFVCTGMIYACLPFLREWATPAHGGQLHAAGRRLGLHARGRVRGRGGARRSSRFFAGWALVLTLLGCRRAASRRSSRNARLRPEIHAADGDRHQAPEDRAEAQGFMGGSFNTREFFHGRPARVAAFGQVGVPAGGVRAAAALLLAGVVAARRRPCWPAAFAVQYAGLLAERWYFFAQANHPQNLYYQAIA